MIGRERAMKRYALGDILKSFVIVAGTLGIFATSADAACLVNNAGRTVYAIVTSPEGRMERKLPVGDKVCKDVGKKGDVRFNILPYGGARFGCRLDLKGEETSILVRFSTMNKCDFSAN